MNDLVQELEGFNWKIVATFKEIEEQIEKRNLFHNWKVGILVKSPPKSTVKLYIESDCAAIQKNKMANRNRKANYNFYCKVYDKYITQLLPLLKSIPSIKDDKSDLHFDWTGFTSRGVTMSWMDNT